MYTPVVATVVICVILICLAVYIDKRPKKPKYNGSISTPPSLPETTPTVVIDGIVVGESAYYNKEEPIDKVSVISVEGNVVEFQLFDGSEHYLPVSEFLQRYSKSETVNISRLK